MPDRRGKRAACIALEAALWLAVANGVLWLLVWVDALGTTAELDPTFPVRVTTFSGCAAVALLLVAPANLVAWLGREAWPRRATMLTAAVLVATSVGWRYVGELHWMRLLSLLGGATLLVVAMPRVWPGLRPPDQRWSTRARALAGLAAVALLLAGADAVETGLEIGLVARGPETEEGLSFLVPGVGALTAAAALTVRVLRRAPRLTS